MERKRGKIKTVKIGRKAMILGAHLAEYLHANTVVTINQKGGNQ
jgi:hypothetical protein